MIYTWSNWHKNIRPYAPGAAEPIIDNAILLAAREYFYKTKTHKSWLDPIKSLNPTKIAAEYEFELPEETEVFEISKASINGEPLAVSALNQLPADPFRSTSSMGMTLIPKDTNAFYLSSAVTKSQNIQVLVLLQPTLTATGIDADIASQHYEAIAFGARANLLELPGFFNPDLSIKNRNDFLQAIDQEKIRAWKGNTQFSTGTNKRMFR